MIDQNKVSEFQEVIDMIKEVNRIKGGRNIYTDYQPFLDHSDLIKRKSGKTVRRLTYVL